MTQLLPRTRAIRALRAKLNEKPLTLLCGNPGIGKSSILEQIFAVNNELPEDTCVFMRFTEHDFSPKGFLRRVSSVIEMRRRPLFEAPQLVIAAIDELPEELIIVVDDLHELGLNREYAEFLTRVIDETSLKRDRPARRWLIAARHIDDFPFARWQAESRATIVDGNELLDFSIEERDQLGELRSVKGHHRLFGSMRTVTLHLAQLLAGQKALQCSREDEPLARAPHALPIPSFRAIEQLITRLRPDMQQCLYRTALLDEIDLVDILEDDDLNAKAIAELGQLGILHYDAALGGVRYDHSVSAYLQATLPYAPIGVIEAATRHAAHAGVRRADVARGFTILAERKAWPQILAILETYGLNLLDHEPVHGCVAAALVSLPHELVESEPVVAGIYGVLTARVGFTDISESWFLNSLSKSTLSNRMRRQIAVRYAFEVLRRERIDAIDILEPIHRELEADPKLDPDLRALVEIAMAVACVQRQRPDAAIVHLQRALEDDTAAFDDVTHARIHQGAAYVRIRLGAPELAISHAEKAIYFADRDGLYDLAAWCTSIREELALNIEHRPREALNYVFHLEYYAWLSEDNRMMLFAAMVAFWIGVELGDRHLMDRAQDQISRSEATDDFMQAQVRMTLVPGTAYVKAWQKKWHEAAHLVESYAPRTRTGHHQAYRWSELAIYYAAAATLSRSVETRNLAYQALRETRRQLALRERAIEHENDVLMRAAIAAVVLERYSAAATILNIIARSTVIDHRAPVILEALAAMLEYWVRGEDTARLRRAMKALHTIDMGGIAELITAMATPMSAVRLRTDGETLPQLT